MPTYNIDIEARFAQAADAFDRVGREAEKSGQRMQAAFRSVQKTLAGIGVGLSVRAFAGFIKDTIDSADKLKDLSKSTGIAIGTLGGLGFAASKSGSDLDSIAKAAGKLNLQIAAASAGNAESQKTFRAMGISVQDASRKVKSADVVLAEIADKFASYDDGPRKAALGFAIFGKAYADILPLLDEGGAELRKNTAFFEKYGGVTKEVGERADQFNDTVGAIKLVLGGLGQQLAGELLPTLQALADYLLAAKDQGDAFKTTFSGIADGIKATTLSIAGLAAVFQTVGLTAGAAAAQLRLLEKGDFSGAMEAGREWRKDIAKTWTDLAALNKAILHPEIEVIGPTTAEERKKKPRGQAPALADTTATAELAKERKRLLDKDLKEQGDIIDREGLLLKNRNDAFQGYYQADYLSISRYFALREQVQDDALRVQLAAFAKQQASLKAFMNDTANPKADRIAAQTKLNDTIAKQVKLEEEVAATATKSYFERAQAVQKLHDAVTDLNAQLQENEGHTAEAAKLRRAAADATMRRFLMNNAPGNVPQFEAQQAQQGAKEQFTERSAEIARAREQLSNQERDIQSAIQRGDMTQLDGIAKIDAARKAMVPTLRKIADELERQAVITKDPATLQSVENLRSEIEALDASANAMGASLRGAFTESLEDPLIDVVNRTKSADEALKDFFNNVAQSLLRMSARNISETLFGNLFKAGAGGGWLSMFGGGGGGGGGVTVPAGQRMALGGVMTEFGPMPLQRYASGGIARRPQLAMFGEGRQSEAFVPLPDGRRIPVAFDRSQVSPAMEPTLAQTQRGPKAKQGGSSPVVLQVHPDALHLTMRDWLEGELARQAATR